jgi:hypothetical protein
MPQLSLGGCARLLHREMACAAGCMNAAVLLLDTAVSVPFSMRARPCLCNDWLYSGLHVIIWVPACCPATSSLLPKLPKPSEPLLAEGSFLADSTGLLGTAGELFPCQEACARCTAPCRLGCPIVAAFKLLS